MIRALALTNAAPDATGTRWVVAHDGDETYLCAKHPDGTEIIDCKRSEDAGPRVTRILRPRKNLNWQPVSRDDT